MEERYLTTDQVANILQVHPYTILKFIKQGKLKGVKLGRVYRIKETEVKRFLEESSTMGRGEPASKEGRNPSSSKKNTRPLSDEKNSEEEGDHYYII